MRDEKELAEHNMLVDLGRNDIGKISEFGSVCVEKYHSIERYSHVMHIGSTVKGTIRSDKDAFDAVYSILPAGTLSGAPKIRACQLINDLENNKRGIYGGAIGYIDFTGNLDTCIAIRIAYKKGKGARYYVNQAGGWGDRAKKGSTYIVHMNGTVNQMGKGEKPTPGSEVIVPTKAKSEVNKLQMWLAVGTSTASIATMLVTIANLVK